MLALFGALFVVLFVVFAVAQGLGAPSVPSGDVALVQGVPTQLGHISEEDFEKALERQASAAKLKKTPKPGEPKYDELKEAALEELLQGAWLQGEAEEMGITVTEKEIEDELAKIKETNFPTQKAYKKFLAESHFTQQEVNERVEQQVAVAKIQEKVKAEAPAASSEAIAESYEAEKATKFTTKESRDVRVVINEDKAKIEAAKKALEKDHSPAGWKKIAAKYSSDATTKSKGGLQPGIQEEFLPEQLKKPLFSAATGELIGPIKVEKNYFELEVVKLNPAKAKSLKEAEAEISATLAQEKQQEFFTEFIAGYESKWRSRTYCASGFETSKCANFGGSGHPASAPAECYEANPATPAKECPAPVTPTQPALPGSVTPLKPKGEPFAQRPRPPAPEEAAATEGAPVPGAAPTPEAAPEGEAGKPPGK
jgi:parvulin-like peptidyl-prolyl isomerase